MRLPPIIWGPYLGVAWVWGGCSGTCTGPQCVDEWPAGRLAVHDGAALAAGESLAWADASGTLSGTVDQGASWVPAALGPDAVLVGQPEGGAVVRVDRLEGAWRVSETWEDAAGAAFGAAVAAVDLDGDGAEELVVGMPDWAFSRGAVVIFDDVAAGGLLSDEAVLRADGASDGDLLGSGVTVCGDLTGDGLPELVVTAPWLAATTVAAVPGLAEVPPLSGGVFVWESERLAAELAAPQGEPLEPWSLGPVWWGGSEGEGAGAAVLCDRDFTGDGVAEILIGAPWHSGGRGRVYVVDGTDRPGSGTLEQIATQVLTVDATGGWFGLSLAAAELDLQPPVDLVVGAPGFLDGIGRAYIFSGRRLGIGPVAELTNETNRAAPDHFARWLTTGDLDGDGVEDLVVGAPDYRVGRNSFDAGRLWIWLGSTLTTALQAGSGLELVADGADVTLVGNQPFQRVGRRPLVLSGASSSDLVLPLRAGG